MEIFVEEEYGFKFYLWTTKWEMTPNELVTFWESLEYINTCRTEVKDILPGTVTELEVSSTDYNNALHRCVWRCHMHMSNDSWLYSQYSKTTYWHLGAKK